jgi:hypothetical protein
LTGHIKFIEDGQEAFNVLTERQGDEIAQDLIAIFLDLKLN